MSDETKQLNKARQALVDRMLSSLDAGAIPWDNGMKGFAAPRNAVSGKHYRGMNAFILMFAAAARGIVDPRWITFNQATEAGYKVKKGARGMPIELYKTIDKRTGKDADIAAIKEEIKDMTFEERQAFKRENLQSFARTYHVFNASDIVGIEPYRAPTLTPADISARNELIEAAIAGSEAPIFYDGNGRNFYSPTTDEIHLTDRAAFTSDEFFYNTALHEMAHSTGHSSRLNRPGGTFGSKEYAREELVAEMASVLVAAEFGLNHSDRVIENSAEYVRSWAQLIRDNPQTLIDAAFDASKATDYICDSERQRTQTQVKTQKESLPPTVSQSYREYVAMQEKYPGAVVVCRLGDFYEVMGESARIVSDELDLTLTGRDVGLAERVPMCGFPYHAMEQYVEKIRQNHAVAVIESPGDEKYMPSLKGAQKTPLENATARKENLQSNVKEWYARTYPTDELASELNANATFGSVRDAIMSGKDIYTELGFRADSVVRERVFRQLADVLNLPYKSVYNAWIENSESAETRKERYERAMREDFPKDFADDFDAPTPAQTEQPKGKTQKESATPAKQQPVPAATFKTNLDNIPAEMKALPNWVAFRTEKLENGKIKKILLSPNKGASSIEYLKWASSTDPTTWSTFEQAAAFAKKYKLEGLSFALSGSGMTCIDLDRHLDESGKPSELAQKFIDAAQGTYIEKSVSGRGLHIFYKGARPEGYYLQNEAKKLENYDTARIISMTGNLYDGAASTLTAPSAELTNLLKSNLRPVQQHVAPSAPLGMDDNALIEKIRSSSRRADFDALWRGELILTKSDGTGDPSRCDYMLCNMLGFFSGGDVAQVERLIKSSGLYRPEKPDKYYAMTARKACDGLRKVYTPAPKSNGTKKNGWKPGGNGKPNGNGSGGNSGR